MVILGRGLDGLNLDTDSILFGVSGLLEELPVGVLGQVLTVGGSGLEWDDAVEQNQDAWSFFSLTGNTSGDVSISANITTDTVTFTGGNNITLIGDNTTKTITIDASGGAFTQNIWETINSDSGSTTANTSDDTLTITGGSGISTAIVADTLTITNDSPNVDQNIWATFNADSGTTVANTTIDELTITGGSGIDTAIVGDVLTITTTALQDITSESIIDLSDTPGSMGTIGQVLAVDGEGILEFVNPFGIAAIERFRAVYNGFSQLVSVDSATSGIDSTSIVGGVSVDITFSGYSYPPVSIMTYGYNNTSDIYLINHATSAFGTRQIDGNGGSAFGALTTTEKLRLDLSTANTGALNSQHVWVVLLFAG